MYNSMNSHYKYTSIPKSFFNKINILILPINTGDKYLKYSIHLFWLYLQLPFIMNLIFGTATLQNFMTSCRDKLYHDTKSNQIKFNFRIIWFGKKSSSKSLHSSGIESEIERMTTSKNSACNYALLNWQNQKFQLVMAGILRVIWPAAIM